MGTAWAGHASKAFYRQGLKVHPLRKNPRAQGYDESPVSMAEAIRNEGVVWLF